LGALTTDGHAAAVAQALVVADLNLAADVCLNLAAQVALDGEVGFDVVTDGDELLVGCILDAQVRAHASGGQDLLGTGTADAVDVGERDLHALFARDVDADDACHVSF